MSLPQGSHTTHGLLLRRMTMPTGGALLEFFTPHFGRITVSVRGLNSNKKLRTELDTLRLLELTLHRGRSRFSLRSARTLLCFDGFFASYSALEMADAWREALRHSTPEEVPQQAFFSFIVALHQHFVADQALAYDTFFHLRFMQECGLVPTPDPQQDPVCHRMVQHLRALPCADFAPLAPQIPASAFHLLHVFLRKHIPDHQRQGPV